MNYEIIFYHCTKTAEIQNTLSDGLSSAELSLSEACAAVSPKELAEKLAAAVKRSKLIFVIGGNDDGNESTEKVLKKVLSSGKADIRSEQIKIDGAVGIIKRASEQTIVLLSDSPEDITVILPCLRQKLAETYKLKNETHSTPLIENITKELDKQMSGTNRVRVAPVGVTAEKRNTKKLTGLKITIAILLLLAAAQLAAASYLYISQL